MATNDSEVLKQLDESLTDWVKAGVQQVSPIIIKDYIYILRYGHGYFEQADKQWKEKHEYKGGDCVISKV